VTLEDSVRRNRLAILPTRGRARQCDAGLPGGRDLSDTLLPVATAVFALWPGWPAPPADAAAAHPWPRADRRPTAAASVGWLAHQRLRCPRDSQGPRLADPLGVADALGGPGRNGRPADRAHGPASATAGRGSAPPGRSSLPRRVLHWQAQGGGQRSGADGVRCGLLLRDRHTGPGGHAADRDRVSVQARSASVRTGGTPDPDGAHRRGPEWQGWFRAACGNWASPTGPPHAWRNGFVERLQGTILAELCVWPFGGRTTGASRNWNETCRRTCASTTGTGRIKVIGLTTGRRPRSSWPKGPAEKSWGRRLEETVPVLVLGTDRFTEVVRA
jgi:hypothetical protein